MDSFNLVIVEVKHLSFAVAVCLLEKESHYIPQTGFELLIFLASDFQVLEIKLRAPGPGAGRIILPDVFSSIVCFHDETVTSSSVSRYRRGNRSCYMANWKSMMFDLGQRARDLLN